MAERSITLNGIAYGWPARPVAVVCIDGGDPAYLDDAVGRGIVPHIARFMRDGFATVAEGVVPSFTCPNNVSIVTGAPPSVHGISGNFFLTDSGEALPMTGPDLLRCRTLFDLYTRAGTRVAAITAKDKLRQQLGAGMIFAGGSVCFSAQCADCCTTTENGIADALGLVGRGVPDMYSDDLSLFVLDAGIALLERGPKPELLYLSLTDFIQHAHAPGTPVADKFYRDMDARFGRLEALGCLVALTADHGMNDKSDAAGTPRVIWLQDELDRRFGAGATRVICPITDAFVAHHGALGGFVRVYCNGVATAEAVRGFAAGLSGVELALTRAETAARFDLPADREGDVAVIGDKDTVIGAGRADHDLSGLAGHRLRTHGAVSERQVPFILSRPLKPDYAARAARGTIASYRIFDYAINGTVA